MEANLNAQDLAKKLTVKVRVHGMRRFNTRIWLGMKFVRFGVWITGLGFEVEDTPNGGEHICN